MTDLKAENSLDAIRREIDGIDDAIAELLIRRFAATVRVRASKSEDGSLSASPLRPAREAMMLRRLIARFGTSLDPKVLVRLWRVILSASTQSQAKITLHVDAELAGDTAKRVQLAEHFCGMDVASHPNASDALASAAQSRGDLAVASLQSGWAGHFSLVARSSLNIISTLPLLGGGSPSLLVFGHAEPQPSGDDQTILIFPSDLATPQFAAHPLWQADSGHCTVTSLPGFLEDVEPGVIGPNRNIIVAGRCPVSIEVQA